MLEQAAARGVGFDAVCALGSGLTHAGTLAGLRVLGERMRVHGICVRRDALQQRVRVLRRTADTGGLPAIFASADELDARLGDARGTARR